MISQLFSNNDINHYRLHIVVRALPRSSKGITDLLLLPSSSFLFKISPSKIQIYLL